MEKFQEEKKSIIEGTLEKVNSLVKEMIESAKSEESQELYDKSRELYHTVSKTIDTLEFKSLSNEELGDEYNNLIDDHLEPMREIVESLQSTCELMERSLTELDDERKEELVESLEEIEGSYYTDMMDSANTANSVFF